MAGIAGGFGSVFGTPVAGFVFGMEVQSVGRIRYDGIIPCLVASAGRRHGDARPGASNIRHYPVLANVEIEPLLLLKVAIAGIAFGLCSILFVELIHRVKHWKAAGLNIHRCAPSSGGVGHRRADAARRHARLSRPEPAADSAKPRRDGRRYLRLPAQAGLHHHHARIRLHGRRSDAAVRDRLGTRLHDGQAARR